VHMRWRLNPITSTISVMIGDQSPAPILFFTVATTWQLVPIGSPEPNTPRVA
jgi:hypothetical protein